MKKALKILGITLLLLLLLRGFLFRLLVTYVEIGERPTIEITDEAFIMRIEERAAESVMDIENITEIAMELTTEILHFTTKRASNNPNELIHTKQANCIGYAALFNSIANYLIQKHQLQEELAAEHKIGQLELLGINVHPFFKSSFFRDHDFNTLRNKKTGVTVFLDAGVCDYFFVDRVGGEN